MHVPLSHRRDDCVSRTGPQTVHWIEALEPRVVLQGSAEPWTADAVSSPGAGVTSVQWRGRSVPARPGRWLLRLDGMVSGTDAAAPDAVAGIQRLVQSRRKDVRVVDDLGFAGMSLLEAPSGVRYSRLLNSLKRLPGFRYLEPDLVFTPDATPNDSRYVQMWQLNNTGQT